MKKLILLLFLFIFLRVEAAAPLTHLFFAEVWNNHVEGYEREELSSFILGNLFPDIRYVANISREMTHFENVGPLDVKEHFSPFLKGMILHSVIDEIREKIVVDSRIYEILNEIESPHLTTLLKLVEDEILWDHFDGKRYLPFLKNIIEAEVATGIPCDTIRKWHFFLGYYLGNKPSQMLYSLALMDRPFLNVPVDVVQRWAFLVPQLAENKVFLEYVETLIASIRNSLIVI